MADFTGAKCEYCKKIFTSDDDVVVCPDCGTPYHRECYLKAGECINYELHEKGGDWEQFYGDRIHVDNNDNDEMSEIKCPRCGTSNPTTGLFCVKCGMPLNSNQESRPFNNTYGGQNQYGNQQGNPYGNSQQTGGFGGGMYGQQPFMQAQTIDLKTVDIDGHKGEEYGKFVKKNFFYYIANFFGFSKNKTKTSLNISAILFPEYYFFYRKMYGLGIALLIFASIIEVPAMVMYALDGMFPGITLPQVFLDNIELISNIAMIGSIARMAVSIVCGLFANYWYFLKAKKTLSQIKDMDLSEEQKDEILAKKGGTSGLALAVSITVNVMIIFVAIIGLVAYFK